MAKVLTVGEFKQLSTTEKVEYYLSIFTEEQLAELRKAWRAWYEDRELYKGTVAEECVLQYMEEMRERWAEEYERINC